MGVFPVGKKREETIIEISLNGTPTFLYSFFNKLIIFY